MVVRRTKVCEKSQIERMVNFTSQIEKASEKPCQIIILGDANLCSQKWNEPGFVNKNVAEVLKNMLEQEGLQCLDVGLTYQAD